MPGLNWDRIEDLFSQAVVLSGAERDAFLRDACAGDAALFEKVNALLAADARADSYLEDTPVSPETMSRLFPGSTAVTLGGQTFGSYRLVNKIGSGGMGSVYLAERSDGAFKKKAAVKIIKRGADSELNLRRFLRERQILADLEHPNIARLLDGGTSDSGLPYLVMEFIEGVPFPEYCDEQGLDVGRRLEIFREICAAVSYAHERGIIHRDLKPTNILVTRDGTPKLLDFGIAKILDSELIHDSAQPTSPFLVQMTPDYASPEQVRNEPITPASDIYSLGILLYEILAGERPYKLSGRPHREMAAVVCDEPVQPPSEKARSRGTRCVIDEPLESIILKALEKRPADRYSSVEDLSGDIGRYLDGSPVLAEAAPSRTLARGVEKTGKSVAVKPLTVLDASGEAAQTDDVFLGTGLADALTTRLTAVRQITVRPTSSVLRFLENSTDSYELGKELEVDYVLEGNILRVGHQIRVTVQLLKIPENTVVWASQFDENETNIFRLQDSIADKTVTSLAPQLSTSEHEILHRRGTTDSAAFEAYLQGRFHWNTYTPEEIVRSGAYFEEAIAHDPQFALAHAGLADYYNWLGVAEVNPPAECFISAKQSAKRAIELDRHLAEAYASLAFATWAYDWDVDTAERLFQKSIRINPNFTKAYEWYAYMLTSAGRHDEALQRMQTAERLDPTSPAVAAMSGFCFYMARRFDKCLEKLYKALRLDPDHALALQGLGWVCARLGKPDEGIEGCRRSVSLSGKSSFNKTSLVLALAEAGKIDEARRLADEIEDLRSRSQVPAYYLTLIHATLGDMDAAFSWLDTAIRERGYWTQWALVEPRLDVLREDPRFVLYRERIVPIRESRDTEAIAISTGDWASTAESTASRPGAAILIRRRIPAFAFALAALILVGTIGFVGYKQLYSQNAPVAVNDSRERGSTVAILPFTTANGGENILGNGLSDGVRSNLVRFKKLSVFFARSQQMLDDAQAGGHGLKPDFILRGSIENAGERTQVSAELVDSKSGEAVWKEKFNAGSRDLPRLQGRIAEKVLNALAIELSSGQRAFFVKPYTEDSEAFQLYLAGRHQMANRVSEDIKRAAANFAEAVERDPHFALAYSGLADTHLLLAQTSPAVSHENMQRAVTFAERAVALDPELAEAHVSLAMAVYESGSGLDRAERHFRRAIEINSSLATAHHWFALMLLHSGRMDEAIMEANIAVALDPFSPVISTAAGTIYSRARRRDEAIAFFEKAISLEQSFVPAHVFKSLTQQLMGDYRGAIQTYRNVLHYVKEPGHEMILELMTAQAFAAEGNRDAAVRLIESTANRHEFSKDLERSAPEVAYVYSILGDVDTALFWMEKIKGYPKFAYILNNDPRFEDLRGDERFHRLIAAGGDK